MKAVYLAWFDSVISLTVYTISVMKSSWIYLKTIFVLTIFTTSNTDALNVMSPWDPSNLVVLLYPFLWLDRIPNISQE